LSLKKPSPKQVKGLCEELDMKIQGPNLTYKWQRCW
jgi:hypothetical protein